MIIVQERERDENGTADGKFFPEKTKESKKPFNWKSPWIITGGVVLILIIGAVVYFLTRKKEPSKDYEVWK